MADLNLGGFMLDMAALKKTNPPDPDRVYDLLVLGGGPAAISAVVYAARKSIAVAVLTKDFGGQVNETSQVDNYLGFVAIEAKKLVESFVEHVSEFKPPISKGPGIKRVERDGELFRVRLDNGETYSGQAVILATGARHRRLGAPGEAEFAGRGVAYCATCDAPFYQGKKVVVAGGGNSAFTTALDLIKVDATVVLVNFEPGWPGDAAMLKRIQAYPRATLLDHHQVLRIEGQDRVKAVIVKDRDANRERRLEADGLFIEIGLSANSDLVKGLVEMNDRGEVVVDCNCRTSVPGLFAAGDVTTVPYKQIVISAGEGAKAALAAHDYLLSNQLI